MRSIVAQFGMGLLLTSPVLAYLGYEWTSGLRGTPGSGPNGGTLVEWDPSKVTVAEVVLYPDCGTVTVHVLDRRAGRPRTLRAGAITLTQTAPRQGVLELLPVPRAGTPTGWSSVFSSRVRVLEPGDESQFTGTISVVANGRRLVGTIRPTPGRQCPDQR